MSKLNEFDVLKISGASFGEKKLALYSDRGDQYAKVLKHDKDMIIRHMAYKMIDQKMARYTSDYPYM